MGWFSKTTIAHSPAFYKFCYNFIVIYMLANKLNYGDTIGVVGVSNSIDLDENGYEVFCKAEEFFIKKELK